MRKQPTLFPDIQLDNNTLFIIGNGFDLAHGIKSSYWNFREWLGNNRSNLIGMMDIFSAIKETYGVILNKLWVNTMKKAF